MKKLKIFLLSILVLCCFVGIFGTSIDYIYAETADRQVYLGGQSIGIVAKTDGVIISGIVDVITKDGLMSPARNSGILVGDIILEIDNVKISSDKEISKAIQNKSKVTLLIERGGTKQSIEIEPALDMISNTNKLGMMVKNEINGIGTLTYVRADNYRFGALGHPISEPELHLKYEFNKGILCESTILGVNKGEAGKAGSIKGKINPLVKMGNLDKNTLYGIFGNYIPSYLKDMQKIKTGKRDTVKMGAAKIYTSIDGKEPKYYDIEIVKCENQDKPDEKSMVIRVTDKELIDKTGGIVQGMSGSPIVQNGRLIGAVTHVFLNDATKGYGIYIDWMIEN